MKVLVIGGGGREHALCWKISLSSLVDEIYCAPGNAGIAKIANCLDISPTNISELVKFAKKEQIELTVVGPEAPLVEGIVDHFNQNGLKIFGPNKKSSLLEGSKAFCKGLLRRHGIPTANFKIFEDSKSAINFIKTSQFPVVIKADGLCAGKGTIICFNEDEAIATIKNIIHEKIFGPAGNKIVIEEYLTGVEATITSITDGKSILVMEASQDFKRIYDGDLGPNTGGMGAYSPVPMISQNEYRKVDAKVLVPLVYALRKEAIPFKGVLYAGITFTKAGPKVLEFNVRFGDPEMQTLLVRLKSDLLMLLLSTVEEKLDQVESSWSEKASVCVVLASSGYPKEYQTGYEIHGVDECESEDVKVFHAGTAKRDGKILSSGGRVLNVAALGKDLKDARDNAYEAIKKISFKNCYFRKDIALKASQMQT